MGIRSRLNHIIKLFTLNGFLTDFLYNTIKINAAFNKMATIKPSITIVPSIACKGITAFVFPPLRIPNSTNRIITDMIKHKLQMNTIFEKKRIGIFGFVLWVTSYESFVTYWRLRVLVTR